MLTFLNGVWLNNIEQKYTGLLIGQDHQLSVLSILWATGASYHIVRSWFFASKIFLVRCWKFKTLPWRWWNLKHLLGTQCVNTPLCTCVPVPRHRCLGTKWEHIFRHQYILIETLMKLASLWQQVNYWEIFVYRRWIYLLLVVIYFPDLLWFFTSVQL